tara:strand:- start:6 stop:2444 length:2439 start_codon:yes stop_codon:yes gene_type:complete
MQKLQLYIKGERVSLFSDENVSFTQTLQNVKDIGKIFTEYSKTFSVPASKNNNKIFNHFYNFDIVNGYDARNKQPAKLELNDLPFKEGLIKLNGVNLKNNVAHTYNITFFGNTLKLKDLLSDRELSSLSSLSQYNKIYSFADVTASMQTRTGTNGDIIVPLITHTDRMIYNSASTSTEADNVKNVSAHSATTSHNGIEWNQFKYGIRVQAIIDSIQSEQFRGGQYLTFSDDFFNNTSNTDFHNLHLWLHRKKGSVDAPAQVMQNFTQVTEIGTSVCVPTNNCQTSTSSVSNGVLSLSAQSPYRISFLNLNVTPPNNTDAFTVKVIRNGSVVVGETTGIGNKQLIIVPWNDSTYTVQIASSSNMVFPIGGIQWSVSWSNVPLGTPSGIGTDGQMIYSNSQTFSTNAFDNFNINEQIPKMKIIDFLTGIFKMFNLTAYVDNDGVIVVRTLDSYYASGSQLPINIDKYLDYSSSTVDVALPFKSIDFTYKGLGTLLAKQFEQINNLEWGSLSYTLNGDTYNAPSKAYKIEIPFEHMQYERLYDIEGGSSTAVQYGYFVDDSLDPYYGLPLLFYPIKQVNQTHVRIRDTENGSVTDIDDYFIPSNSVALNASTSKVSIHFGNEINEYQANESSSDLLGFTDSFFESKYKTYIENVFNVSRRITKVSAHLPMKIYYNLKLNDLIQLGQNNYKINSLTTNLTTGKTNLELLNDVKKSVPFSNSTPTPVDGVDAVNIGATSVTIEWDPSTSPDGFVMSYYVVSFNNNPVGGSMAQPLLNRYSDDIEGLTTGTTYTVTIVAYDIYSNTSTASSPYVFTTN